MFSQTSKMECLMKKVNEKVKKLTFKLTKDQQRLKQNDHLFSLMFLLFHFLHSNVPGNKCHKQSVACYFLHASN